MKFIGDSLPELNRFALYLTRNRADADDLVGWTALAAIENLHRHPKHIPAPLPWLKKIARRQYIERFCRKKKVDAGRVCYFDEYGSAQPEQESAARAVRVQDIINGLSYVDREIVGLHVQGFTIKEIARFRAGKYRSNPTTIRRCIERFQSCAA